MAIKLLDRGGSNILGFEVTGKLTAQELQDFLPHIETVVREAKKKLRLLIDVTKMDGADIKSEWEVFRMLKKHMEDIEYIALVGAHSWTKVMSEILAESIFVEAETRYFQPEEIEAAWNWIFNAAHPDNIPVRRVINSSKGLFTSRGSPDYI